MVTPLDDIGRAEASALLERAIDVLRAGREGCCCRPTLPPCAWCELAADLERDYNGLLSGVRTRQKLEAGERQVGRVLEMATVRHRVVEHLGKRASDQGDGAA